MQRRQLIRSAPPIFPMGLGCLNFSGFYGPSSENEAHRTLARAMDLGIEMLDMADIYGFGLSEEIVGRFLSTTSSAPRLATKAGIWRDKTRGNRGFNNRPDYLRGQLEGSLRRLGRDHIDLFYIHRRDPDIQIEEVMETLLAFKAEGKIGGIGFSEISPASLRRAVRVGRVDAVQSEYSLWSRLPDLGLRQACEEFEIALVAYSPLGRGILTDVVPDPARFSDADFRRGNPRFQEPNLTHNLARVAPFRTLAADIGVPTAALAIAWCLAQSDRIIPVPGTRSAEHVADFVAGVHVDLSRELSAEIERILPVGWAHGDRYSRDQWNGPEGYC